MTALVLVQSHFKDYLELGKYKVVLMLLLTAWVGIALAPDMGRSLMLQLLSLIGIGFLSSSAAVMNHLIDQRIDERMARTHNRPLVKGRVSNDEATVLAVTLLFSGSVILYFAANLLTMVLTLFALVGYALIYTRYLKHATPQNIVIGGLAGAMPPLLGWVSETGTLSAEPWLLVMIVFVWTPPHFWALAIHRVADYKRAGVPMLPVTHGIEFTKTSILLYSIVLYLVCLVPYLVQMSGLFYFLCTTVLNAFFIASCWQLKFKPTPNSAYQTFKYSIYYLGLLFLVLLLDKWLFF